MTGSYTVVRTNGFVGACIRLVTRARYNHAFIVVNDMNIVEASFFGAKLSLRSSYDGHLQADNAPESLTDAERARIAAAALTLIGTPYSFLDILALLLASVGIRWRLVAKMVGRENRLICSQLVDKAYLLAGVHLYHDGRLPQNVTPGDLADRLTRRVWDAPALAAVHDIRH